MADLPLTIPEARAILAADEALVLSSEARLAFDQTLGVEEQTAWGSLVESARVRVAGLQGSAPEKITQAPSSVQQHMAEHSKRRSLLGSGSVDLHVEGPIEIDLELSRSHARKTRAQLLELLTEDATFVTAYIGFDELVAARIHLRRDQLERFAAGLAEEAS